MKEGRNQWEVKSSFPTADAQPRVGRQEEPWAVPVPSGVKGRTMDGYSHLSYYNLELCRGLDNAVTSGKTEVIRDKQRGASEGDQLGE